MSAKEFNARLDMLAAEIGAGRLSGHVEVDQVYAHRQHEDALLRHPRGGGPFYLTRPLLEGTERFMSRLADGLFEPDGLQRAMEENVEDLASRVAIEAPVEFGFLRLSAHPTVVDDGVTTYDRPPIAPRLTHEEIKALNRLRDHL